MIMHHIKDSHEFHILDWNGKGVSIPLPIILWTDNGLVTFSSSEFHHDDEGTELVTKKGVSFVKFHEEIYYASPQPNSFGQYLTLDKNNYLRKSFVHTGSFTSVNTSSFTAVTASAPTGLTGTTEQDFMFFINGIRLKNGV